MNAFLRPLFLLSAWLALPAIVVSCTAGKPYKPAKLMQGAELASFLSVRRAAVVAPLVGEKDKAGHAGSAAPIHPQGYLITAAHVVDGTDLSQVKVMVILPSGKPSKPLPARVVNVDRRADVALLKIDQPTPRFFQWTPAEALIPAGTPVVHTGLVTAHKTGIGELTTAVSGNRMSHFSHTLRLQPGDSGGGLVTLAGELVGVNSAIGTIEGFGASFFSGAVSTRPSIARIQAVIAKDLASHP